MSKSATEIEALCRNNHQNSQDIESEWTACFLQDQQHSDNITNAMCDAVGETGKTPLMIAAEAGNVELVTWLLDQGAPWNAQDANGLCAGDYAMMDMKRSEACYNVLLQRACTSELLLAAVGKNSRLLVQQQDSKQSEEDDCSNRMYLEMPLTFASDGTKICDHEGHGVMMDWEKPLMDLHAAVLCSHGGDILNVGFGLGIIDTAIQACNPRSHTIIEAHPDVYQKMIEQKWHEKPNVRIVFGRWQDVIENLGHCYDGIFFDTYGEFYKDLHDFHEHLPNILNEDGVYSFFNGLGASTNRFFHEVYTELVKLELAEMTIQTTYVDVHIGVDAKIWEGVTRPYWVLQTYHLPICRFFDGCDQQDTQKLVTLVQDMTQKNEEAKEEVPTTNE